MSPPLLAPAALLMTLAVTACNTRNPGADGRGFLRDTAMAGCDQGANDWRQQGLGPDVITNPGSGLAANLMAVWGASAMAVWAVGDEGKVIFFDGQTWSAQATPTKAELTSVTGTGIKDVWAAGHGGTVIRFNGESWVDVSPPDPVFVPVGQDGGPPKGDAAIGFRRNLWGIWAAGSATTGTQELFAVGDRGLVLHWANNAWIALKSDVEDDLFAVWGSGTTAYVAGDFGTLLTGGAGGLTQVNTGIARKLLTIWGRGGDVYAAGVNGTLLHGSGGAWAAIEGPPKQVMKGLWGPDKDPSRLYMVGIDGTLLRLTGGPAFASATVELFPCLTKNRLNGIWGYEVPAAPGSTGPDSGQGLEERIWAVGVSGTVLVGP